jgi:hypothetical protein
MDQRRRHMAALKTISWFLKHDDPLIKTKACAADGVFFEYRVAGNGLNGGMPYRPCKSVCCDFEHETARQKKSRLLEETALDHSRISVRRMTPHAYEHQAS